MILLVGGEKGGNGKSCLAQNLAVYLRCQFQGEVLLVDCDPQRTTSDWIQERNDNPELPQINCVQLYGNIRNDLLSLKNRTTTSSSIAVGKTTGHCAPPWLSPPTP
ncbi:AAA family ATPase [Aeromonas veronii]